MSLAADESSARRQAPASLDRAQVELRAEVELPVKHILVSLQSPLKSLAKRGCLKRVEVLTVDLEHFITNVARRQYKFVEGKAVALLFVCAAHSCEIRLPSERGAERESERGAERGAER